MPTDPFDKAVCPGCGWIGSTHSVAKDKSCPRCDYGGVTSLRRMRWNESLPVWDDVDMPKFLGALQRLGVLPDSYKV
jgi:ribosomal protein L37E